jgi:hypothetical protein
MSASIVPSWLVRLVRSGVVIPWLSKPVWKRSQGWAGSSGAAQVEHLHWAGVFQEALSLPETEYWLHGGATGRAQLPGCL